MSSGQLLQLFSKIGVHCSQLKVLVFSKSFVKYIPSILMKSFGLVICIFFYFLVKIIKFCICWGIDYCFRSINCSTSCYYVCNIPQCTSVHFLLSYPLPLAFSPCIVRRVLVFILLMGSCLMLF